VVLIQPAWRLVRDERELHGHRGAAAEFTIGDPRPAAVGGHGFVDDREAESRPSGVPAPAVVESHEAVEDALAVFGGYAWPIV
jgi:hypothetical protein